MKIGDKVVYVDSNSYDWFNDSIDSDNFTNLELGKIYTVLDTYDSFVYKSKFLFLEEISYHFTFNAIRFKKLTDIRKEKIEKLCSK